MSSSDSVDFINNDSIDESSWSSFGEKFFLRSAEEGSPRSRSLDTWSPTPHHSPQSNHSSSSSIGSFINDGHISSESWTSSEYVMRRILANSSSSSSSEDEYKPLPDSPVLLEKGVLKRKMLISSSSSDSDDDDRNHKSVRVAEPEIEEENDDEEKNYFRRRILANSSSSSSSEDEYKPLPDSPVPLEKGDLKRKILISSSDSDDDDRNHKSVHAVEPEPEIEEENDEEINNFRNAFIAYTPPRYGVITPPILPLEAPEFPIPMYEPASPPTSPPPSPPLSGDGTYYDDDDEIPAPRVLGGFRLFLPYSGCIEVGFTPTSDGYGHANVDILLVIQYGKYWLSLNEVDVAEFFTVLRTQKKFENVGDPYFSHCDWYTGRFLIDEIEQKEAFNIQFVDEEGERSTLYDFDYYDLITLLKMEKLIGTKILSIKPTAREVIENIEAAAQKCLNDVALIGKLAEKISCNDIDREMAINHFGFFYDFIEELQKIESAQE